MSKSTTVTWRTIAERRGFRDNGNRTWTAPSGQVVAEGFVSAHCSPVRIVAEALFSCGILPTTCQPTEQEERSDTYGRPA